MYEYNCGNDYIAVPYESVCLNGLYMRRLNTAPEDYVGPFVLVKNGQAIMGEDGRRPYKYDSLADCMADQSILSIQETPTTEAPTISQQIRTVLFNYLGAKEVPKKTLSNGRVEVMGGARFVHHSLEEVAKATGIHPSTLSRFLANKGGLSQDGIDALGRILKLRIQSD